MIDRDEVEILVVEGDPDNMRLTLHALQGET
jgi:hypothetical protein